MHKMYELRPETVLKMLDRTRSLNDDQRAKQIALCCIADAKGRTGFEDREYSQADQFLRYQQAAKSVDGKAIAVATENKAKVPETIKRAQVKAIMQIKREAGN